MADVTSTFGSLSSTESSNAPAGTVNIGTGLDENLRMIQSHIAAIRDQTGWGGINLASVAGTNTITATLAAAGSVTFGPTAYATGQRFFFIPANTNTGATTINITSPAGGSALGAKNIFSGGAACVGGELISGVPACIVYDGTQFNLLGIPHLSSTWTPVLTCVTPGDLSVAYTTQFGNYTRIGRQVTVVFNIVTSAFTHTTASGAVTITGLPFTVQNTTSFIPMGGFVFGGVTKANYTNFTAEGILNSTQIQVGCSGSAQNAVQLAITDCPTGGTVLMQGSVTYFV